MKKITVSKAKEIREEIGATHLVLFAIMPDGLQHVATHGDTVKHAKEAAKAGNKLKTSLGWPQDLCNSKPLERIHENCHYYKPDYGIFTVTGWTSNGECGHCCYTPGGIKNNSSVKGSDIACSHFEPKED